MVIMAYSGVLTLSRWRVELWAITVAALVASTFFQWHDWSSLSMWFLLIVYTPLVLVVDGADEETYKAYLEPFQWLMIPVALLGVYQFVTVDTFDPFERFGSWVIVGYNTHPPLSFGSTLLRSNAYVLLEPSFLSQYCAIAILMELAFYHKRWRYPIYAAGLFSSAGGTGLVVLMIFAVSYAWRHKKMPHVAIAGAVALVTLSMFPDNPVIQNMLGRTTEITSPGSSGYGRFVAPFVQASIQLEDVPDWITGLGPGAGNGDRLVRSGWSLNEIANLMAPIKMVIEYGLMGAVPFMIFITRAFFDRSRSVVLSLAMFICYTFMSSSLQHPPAVYLSYVIAMMFPMRRDDMRVVAPRAP
jgi:hypothetical protein